jgi:pyridoxal phosphate enzyme (YggS family)
MAGTGVADRLAEVRRRIDGAAARAGRDPAAVRLVAVTKTVAPERIAEAATAGITDIGENRVQEALAKQGRVPDTLVWHLIGHLQSNKAPAAARLFDAVHSIDSGRIAIALAGHRDPDRGPLLGLVEVDFTGVAGRTGVAPDRAEAVLGEATGTPGLEIRGLMTIAPFGDPAAARDCFRRLRDLRDRLREGLGLSLPELSMGMSDDFEIAVEEGATLVRLGRVIFGERPPA